MQLNMTDDVKTKLRISAILFKNHVPIEEAKFIGKYIEDLEEKNRMLVQMERNTYETSQEIMAELTSEKQELIDYLREQINNCKLKGCNYEKTYICGKESSYKEILSKLEKE